MVWRKRRSSSTCLVRVVVGVFEAVLVGGLAPTPPRPLMFALQRGSASTPVTRRRIYNGDCVARSCARGGLVSNWGDRGGANGMALNVGARGRVGWLDLLVVDEIPPFLAVVLVVVVFFFVVVSLFRRILFLASRQNLDTR